MCPTYGEVQYTPPTTAPFSDYPYIIVSDTLPQVSDSLFNALARGVIYKVNTIDIADGERFLTDFRKLLPRLKAHGLSIRGAFIRGAASPEGPYDNNVSLARRRAVSLAAMLTAIADSAGVLTPIRTVSSISEDYGYLVELMRHASDPDAERVDSVCRRAGSDYASCKRQLMRLDGGRLWRRVLLRYYPAIRRAGVLLWASRDTLRPPGTFSFSLATPAWPDPMPSVAVPPALPPRKRMLALRTNLIQDFLWLPHFQWAAMMPNLQAEYFPLQGHYTYNAGFSFSNYRHWSASKFFQVRDIRAGVRRYFRGGGRFEGSFVGAYGEATFYGIGYNDDKGWEGEGGGAGLTAGHTMRLNRRGSLRLELTASLGAFFSKQDPYVWGNPRSRLVTGLFYYRYTGRAEDFRKRQHHFFWIGPTNVGIQITYDILYHKRGKGGAL